MTFRNISSLKNITHVAEKVFRLNRDVMCAQSKNTPTDRPINQSNKKPIRIPHTNQPANTSDRPNHTQNIK